MSEYSGSEKMVLTKSEPIRIEFELTNYCNASCEFCPRFNIADYGFMELEQFSAMIAKIRDIRQGLSVFQHNPSLGFPHVVFGGYGEALLHKDFPEFISIAKVNYLPTELITNGALLTLENCKRLVTSGLDKLSISLHTLDSKVNEQIMNRADTKETVRSALEFLDDFPIGVEIWRVGRLDGGRYDLNEDADAFKRFLSPFKKEIPVLGPTPAWNRGGQYQSTFYPKVRDSEEVRCHTLNYSLSVSFNGDLVLCCCDFSLKSVKLAENWDFDFATIQKKVEYCQQNPPQICQECGKPKDTYYVQFIR
ncbi:radical SAM protein [Candidatus Woesearchaeota archaeon]|nr:radical SAM protein [Candidatus Woesearchaeota archaeon]